MPMNKPCIYEIRVEGVLADGWSDWFEEMDVHAELTGETTLKGPLTDQAALFSVLTRIHSLNLELISVNRCSA